MANGKQSNRIVTKKERKMAQHAGHVALNYFVDFDDGEPATRHERADAVGPAAFAVWAALCLRDLLGRADKDEWWNIILEEFQGGWEKALDERSQVHKTTDAAFAVQQATTVQ